MPSSGWKTCVLPPARTLRARGRSNGNLGLDRAAPDGPEAGPASSARARPARTGTPSLPLTRVLKRPIVCSEGVKVNSSPSVLPTTSATSVLLATYPATLVRHDDARTAGQWDRPFLHEVFHVYTTVSCSSCSTRTRLSQAPSRPVWSVSPKARWTSGDLCIQHKVGLPQTTQAHQGHVFGGFLALVQQSSQAPGHRPRLAREFVRSAVRGDSTLVNYRLADCRVSSTEAPFQGQQLMQLAGSSLWGSGCAPRLLWLPWPP